MLDLTDLMVRGDKFVAKLHALRDRGEIENQALEKAREEQRDLKGTIALLQYLATEINKNNEDQVANLATQALQEVFSDLDLSLVLEHGNYRGHPGVTFKLRDNRKKAEGDPMDAFGGGPASLLGLVLQVISVARQPGMSKVLILDEPVVQVSAGYQEAVGKMLRKLCTPPPHGAGFKMLVVTHLESIAAEANKRYRAVTSSDGTTLDIIEEV